MNVSVSFSKEDLLSRIDQDQVAPSLKNKKFTISEVLGLLLSGMSAEEIMYNYPDLEREDVMASLLYAMQVTDAVHIR